MPARSSSRSCMKFLFAMLTQLGVAVVLYRYIGYMKKHEAESWNVLF